MSDDKNYYRNILDNMPEGVQVIDFEWRYIYINNILAQQSHYTKEELLGAFMYEKYPQIKQTKLWSVLNNCMRNRVADVFESEFVYSDLTKSYFELKIQPVPEGLLILSVDQSENISAKKQLQLSHERLLFHIEHSPLGFIQLNDKLNIQMVSSKTVEIFGWKEEQLQLPGYFGNQLIYKDDMWLAVDKMKELIEGNADNNKVLLRCYNKEGNIIWCEWFNTVLKNKEGNVISIVSLIDDVTKEKNAENSLLKVNRLYAFLSASNQSIIHFTNKQELFDHICAVAIDIGKFKTAWIALISDKTKLLIASLRGYEHSGHDYQKYSGTDFSEVPYNKTTIGRVLQTGEYAISNDVRTDPDMQVWKEVFEKLDVRSSITLPLKIHGKLVGVIGINSSIENFFDDEEIALLREAAGDISFALQNIDQAEHHAAIEKLIEYNEKRFRALVEKSLEVRTLSTLDGKFLYCSPSVTRILGYTIDEFLQLGCADLIHAHDLESFLKEKYRIAEIPGNFFTYQLRLHRKAGDWIWCECTMTNLLNEPGINAFVSNFVDISERKLSEQRRQFDQNNLNALINSTQDLMWSLYKDYRLITFNKPYESMVHHFTGKTIMQGSDVREFAIPLKRLQRIQSFYDRAFSGEVFTEIQYVDGLTEMWLEITFAPIYKNSDVIGAACHARNITLRKTIEEQLRRSEAFSKGVIDSLSSHIAVIDSDGTIIAVNEAWKRFANTTVDTALLRAYLGNNYINNLSQSALTGDAAASEAINGIIDVMNRKKEVFYFEYPCAAENKNYWFSMRVMKFESDESLIVISQFDISSRKQAELERTDIVNALVQRNKDLEQFSYIVSHNLRAPVANIIGAADLINEPGLTQEDKEILINGLGLSSKRLDEVLKDMNFILKVRDVNNQTRELIKLSNLFNTVMTDIHYLTEDNSISITSDFSVVNELYSFKTYIYSIFYNLITNSIKYRQYHKQTFITVTSKYVDNCIELIFSDNGIGINLEKKGKEVFGLYKRFHPSIEGKGMGLFLVKTQVEALGGKITIESQENVGSTFRIELPL